MPILQMFRNENVAPPFPTKPISLDLPQLSVTPKFVVSHTKTSLQNEIDFFLFSFACKVLSCLQNAESWPDFVMLKLLSIVYLGLWAGGRRKTCLDQHDLEKEHSFVLKTPTVEWRLGI
jgi:hypothetical protein